MSEISKATAAKIIKDNMPCHHPDDRRIYADLIEALRMGVQALERTEPSREDAHNKIEKVMRTSGYITSADESLRHAIITALYGKEN